MFDKNVTLLLEVTESKREGGAYKIYRIKGTGFIEVYNKKANVIGT